MERDLSLLYVCTFERVVRWEGENLNKMRAKIYSRVGGWLGGGLVFFLGGLACKKISENQFFQAHFKKLEKNTHKKKLDNLEHGVTNSPPPLP